VITGASESLMATVNEQLAVLPEVSVAVQFTVLVPLANVEPEAGVQTRLSTEQLSLAVAAYVTLVFVQWPASAFATMLDGQAIDGAAESRTVTVNEQLRVLPELSVAVQVTVLVPLANVEPDDGTQLTDDPAQLSPNVGAS
jgi:hypothetical protein